MESQTSQREGSLFGMNGSHRLAGIIHRVVTFSAILFVLAISASSFGQQAEKEDANAASQTKQKLTFEETVAELNSRGNTEEAMFLTQQMERAQRYLSAPSPNCGVMFGRLVVPNSGEPQLCDAQMDIHKSGWFVSQVGDIKKPVEFRMWGHIPYLAVHPGPSGAVVNVGDIVLKPFPARELTTVRAEVRFEGKVDPKAVVINAFVQHPPINSISGGTNGFIPQPDKEGITLGSDFRFEKSGLSPLPHYLTIKAPGHRPFYREFQLQAGITTDLGVLDIATSPAFEVEFATADGLDFTKVERKKITVYAGDQFPTNPDGKNWGAGNLRFQEQDATFFFRCGLASLVITDLGEGKLEDHLTPVHEKRPRQQLQDNTPVTDGHVYLVSHTMKKIWKHATVMRIHVRPYEEQDAKTK